ncbi:MAG TPA: cysteine--tRNA ligase [Phycisphaerae bacterium]|nr:cysteine--tRNA ligase [Phycisphaerae bacterium]
MPTRFYNTLAHELQPFTPLLPGPDPASPLHGATVKLYTCGPTVYDYAHIGNFRAFLFADLLRRYLEFRGATVQHVMNMTDVGHMTDDSLADATGEDKMSKAGENLKKESKKQGKALVENPDDPYQVAQFFVDAFLADARALQLEVVQDYDLAPETPPLSPQSSVLRTKDQIMPRPTRFIPPFISMIDTLIKNNHAYLAPDGVVYYNVASFPSYGQLSGNSVEQLSHGAGGRTAESAAKKHPADFFLWKPDNAHIMKWPSPWGTGYPGWHIECSAMATTLLGPSIDIHTGGEDNIFPHHECEIAQSEAATGKKFANFWMHTRHLMVDGQKMSKSKGNFFTIRDLVAKGYDPLAIRLALINTRYRESMNFSLQGLQDAATNLATLRDLAEKLHSGTDTPVGLSEAPLEPAESKLLDDIAKSMDDDLNISAALAAIFTWAAPLSKQKKIPDPQARSALSALKKIDHLLAVIFPPLRPLDPDTTQKIETLMHERAAARAAKDWPKSDELRKQLAALNVEVKDAPTGSTWRPRLAPP